MPQKPTRPITQKEVAERAGVSLSAVSRAFTDGASISTRTKVKIEKAAKDLGYRPNILAQSLMTNRTRLIGLVSSNFENPAFSKIFDLFTRELQARNYRTLLENLTERCEPEAVLERLLQYRVDAVLFASSILPTAFTEVCAKANLPAAVIFGRPEKTGMINTVTADNFGGAREGTEYLLKHNYKKIAFLGGPKSATTTQDRKTSVINTLDEYGGHLVAIKHCDTYSYEEGREKSLELLIGHSDIDAIFCGDDILAIATIDTIRGLGMRCPEDIGVLGFNDIPMASWGAYNLTTVQQPIQQMVTSAIDMVTARIENPGLGNETRLFPCKLVVRGSLRLPQPEAVASEL